ncbi:MAG: hypothetical protein QOD57_4999 [Actinomycetota bacterium]|nr:hypothetical protein [Actinomycetota bacterium]
MITAPTTAQLLDVVRRELAEKVAPAVTDPHVATSLHMIDHILRTLAVRAEHELGWMGEEMSAIEMVASRVAASDLPGAASVAQALEEFRANVSPGLHAADVAADYNRATEVLSRAVEATFPAVGPEDGGELRAAVNVLLDQRLAHETDVIGDDFQLVGHS